MSEIIDLTKGDKTLVNEIIGLVGDGILKCFECNKCSALCPPRSMGNMYRYMKLIRMIKLGLRDKLMEDPSPWGCTLCNRCTEWCPKKADPSLIIVAIRLIQAKELAVPMSTIEGLMSLIKSGHGVFNEKGEELREKVGLPKNPPSAIQNPIALEELKTILSKTKLVDMGIL